MFDDLDDAGLVVPGPDARQRVAARAARIRRNQRVGWTTGLASVVLMAVMATAAVVQQEQAPDTIGPAGTGSPTAAESPSPSPPSATPSPTPSATRTARAGGQPPPVAPQPTTTPQGPPDLVAQWFERRRAETCRPAASLAPGMTNNAHVSLRLEVPATVDADSPGMANLVITNISDKDIYFVYRGAERGPVHTIAADDNGTYSGQTVWTGVVDRPVENEETRSANLDAGESVTESVPILLDTCAPERTAAAPGSPAWLPAGTYRMAVTIQIVDSLEWDPRATTGPESTESETPSPSPSDSGPVLISSDVVTVAVG